MQAISVRSTMTVPVEGGRRVITLEAGRPYVMHEAEVESGRRADAFGEVAALPARPRRFDPQRPGGGRLLVPFIGGLGDAVSLLPVLASIRDQHPRLALDVSATPGPAEVFALSAVVDHVVGYPPPVSDWRRYDHYLTLEAVDEAVRAPDRPLPEIFAAALGVQLTRRDFGLRLPRTAEAAAAPSSVPLVGLAGGEQRGVRAYPPSSLRQLVSLLVAEGVACVLLGHADPGCPLPVCPPVITDMRSRTPTVLELAVWLRAVDVAVCHDAFPMHLAGALQRPTVALFAPSSAARAAPYGSVDARSSSQQCAPCHATGAACPRGLDRCVAWDSVPLQPPAVAEAVLDRLRRAGRLAPVADLGTAAAL